MLLYFEISVLFGQSWLNHRTENRVSFALRMCTFDASSISKQLKLFSMFLSMFCRLTAQTKSSEFSYFHQWQHFLYPTNSGAYNYKWNIRRRATLSWLRTGTSSPSNEHSYSYVDRAGDKHGSCAETNRGSGTLGGRVAKPWRRVDRSQRKFPSCDMPSSSNWFKLLTLVHCPCELSGRQNKNQPKGKRYLF